MTEVRFIGDLHLGHKNILKMSPIRGGTDVISHSEWIVEQWNSVVGKRDVVYILGDVCWHQDHLKYIKMLRGRKILILGNHDYSAKVLEPYFNSIRGTIKYKGFWLSHIPMHPVELRGAINVHGHIHNQPIPDHRYVNVCVEALGGKPRTLTSIKEQFEK